MRKPTDFDRRMGGLMPLVFPRNIKQALLYIALALALLSVMGLSKSLWFQVPALFVFAGLIAPSLQFFLLIAANFDAYVVKRGQGDDQVRWRRDSNKRK